MTTPRQGDTVPKVLLIDAEEDDTTMLQELLLSHGAEVHPLQDARKALQNARDIGPDLIVLAVELPGLSGYTVCGQLRRDPTTQHIPIIITSSTATPDTFAQHRNLKTNASAYLHKPIDPQNFIATAAEHIPLNAPSAQSEQDIIFEEPDFTSGDMPLFDDDADEISIGDLDLPPLGAEESVIGDLDLEALIEAPSIDAIIDAPISPPTAPVAHSQPPPQPPPSQVLKSPVPRRPQSIPATPAVTPTPAGTPEMGQQLQRLQEEVERLRDIESTQQNTIDRQQDEITELREQIDRLAEQLAASPPKDELDALTEERDELRREKARLADQCLSLEEEIGHLHSLRQEQLQVLRDQITAFLD